MLYAAIIIAALAITAVAGLRLLRKDSAGEDASTTSPSCGDCSLESGKCARECAEAGAARGIEYFDDEELDSYRGRESCSYTDTEAEEFAEVMLTMRPEEVKDWGRSLTLRGINLPDQLKDEYIMLAGG